MRETSSDAFVRRAMIAGTIMSAAKNTGPKTVLNTNHRVRTRSRYSRAVMTQSLPMPAHPLLHAARAHAVEKDPVQRGPYELEPLDGRTGSDESRQELLRGG